MKVVYTIAAVREAVAAARRQGKTIGFVPTMGALHQGHTSLIDAARSRCGFVVVSIFVNPTQFGPNEDLSRYPRPIEQDTALCNAHGADLVFAPTALEMYGQDCLTWVHVERLTEPLCGHSRPGHFRGVATVCAKLFNIVAPDLAFFGQKDAQQVVVIQTMVADLNMPLSIIVCPTVREPDGLAMSSRNRYLEGDQRRQATVIHKALCVCQDLVREQGARDSARLVASMTDVLHEVPGIRIDYVSVVDGHTLETIDLVAAGTLVAIAARIGSTRLIDNIVLDVS